MSERLRETPRLTDAQREAVTLLDRDVCVSAGAGSGKTAVLIQRFSHIVESGAARVDEILTVTFTEKSAQEMKSRIVDRFQSLGLEDERRAVETAYLGTIHGFCARLLRENAFEAGIDPEFHVLDDAAASMMRDDALEEATADLASDPSSGVLGLLADLGRDAVRTGVREIFQRMRSLGYGLSEVPPPLPPVIDFSVLLGAVDRLLAFGAANRTTPIFQGKLQTLRAQRALLVEGAEAPTSREYGLRVIGDVRGTVKGVPPKAVKPLVEDVKAACDEVRDAILEGLAITYLRPFRDLLTAFAKRYEAAKEQAGALDFDDLLWRTRGLLEPIGGSYSAVAARYQGRFQHILMDEFQDTNRLQKGIVDALRRPGRFFVVGDIKQSIFGFIGSDMTVFRDHEREVTEEGGRRIRLAENFRSRRPVIDFVNAFFEELWSEDEDFLFEPLVAGAAFPEDPAPAVELLTVAPDGRLDTARFDEARGIARRIQQLVGHDQAALQVTARDGTRRPAQYRDILVLLRATSAVSIYEWALHEAGVPFYVVSGRGFYDTPEVQHLTNLLRVLENPRADIPLAAVLRSPLVGVSDDALYWMTRDWGETVATEAEPPSAVGGPGTLNRNLRMGALIPTLAPVDRERLVRFHELYERLQPMRTGARIADVVDCALEATDFEAKVLAQRNGTRRYANVRKFRETAQEFERTGLSGLHDFIEYLETLEVVAQRETEAPTETETDNVVRIMTIHRAKGLEAPIVIVADLARKTASHAARFLFSPEGGIACQVAHPETGELLPPRSYRRAQENIQARERGESKRLFYVAATRARERLILAGGGRSVGLNKPYRDVATWDGWVQKAIGIGEEVEDRGPVADKLGAEAVVEYRAEPSTPHRSHQTTLSEVARKALESGRPIAAKTVPGLAACAEQARSILSRLEPAQVTPEPKARFSVSELLEYQRCPAHYRFQREIGTPETLAQAESGDTLSAVEMGQCVHDVLSRCEPGDTASLQRALAQLTCDPGARGDVESRVQALLATPTLAESAQDRNAHRELPFEVKVEEAILTGKIDLLYRLAGRGWVVVDYKTGGRGSQPANRLQVALYAYAVAEIVGEPPERVVLLFSSGGAPYDQPVTADMLQEAQGTAMKLIDGIQVGRFESAVTSACQWCDYRETACDPRVVMPDHPK